MEHSARVGRWRRRLLWLLAVTILLVFLFSLRNQLLPPLGRWLDVSTPPRNTEYVMVLGGGDERRPFVAATLMRRGYSQKAVIPTLSPSPDVLAGNVLPTHERMKRVFMCRGVAEEDLVILDTQIRTTFDEASALRQFLAQRSEAQVAIVTDDYHTRRTRWVFRKSLGDRAEDVYFVAAPVDGVTDKNWWQTRDGLKAYTSEYLKLAYYWCRYGRGLMWITSFCLLILLIAFRRTIRFWAKRLRFGRQTHPNVPQHQ